MEAEGRGKALELGSAHQLEFMAAEHLTAALPLAVSGGWMGDHWLHTFALLASEAYSQLCDPQQTKLGRL